MSSSIVKTLLERRVPQYLALYLGVSWGIVEFMSFLEDRFAISPNWTNLVLFGLALLIPSVVLFTYFHGRPGRDRWMRIEMIGIPLNVLVALGVLFIEFEGKDLGGQLQTLQGRDEHGAVVERVVPKAEYRKRVAVFYFDALSGDTARWLQYGVPTAVLTDLSQDMFVDLRFGPFFRERLRQAGYTEEVGVPLALKRKIAQDLHLGFIVSGSVGQRGGQYVAQVALHDASVTKLIRQWEFSDATPQGLADQISLEVRRGLGIPSRHIEESVDLPVSETMTPSLAAFRYFAEGDYLTEVHDDYDAAARMLERAVQEDPTFAAAHYSLHVLYLVTNQAQRAMPALQSAMDHLYRLPERVQNVVKAQNYYMRQEREKAYAVAQLNTELYPEDIRSRQVLLQLQMMRGDKDEAIRSMRSIFELDPNQAELLQQIGQVFESKAQYDTALTYYSQYAERFPQKRESFISLGRLHARSGRYTEAKRAFDKALLVEPGAVPPMIQLARLELDHGHTSQALRVAQEALASARTAEDRAAAHGALRRYYVTRGQFRRALEQHRLGGAAAREFAPPLNLTMDELLSLDLYVRAGEEAEGERLLEEHRAALAPPMDLWAWVGELMISIERRQPERAERAVAGVEQMIRGFGLEALAALPAQARGEIMKLRGQWPQAAAHFEEALRTDPTKIELWARAAEAYREANQLERAERAARRVLTVEPADPRANLEMGLVLSRRGNAAGAREHLQRAVDMWADADPGYDLARKAREALAAVSGTART